MMIRRARTAAAAAAFLSAGLLAGPASTEPAVAAEGDALRQVWHLGRITGDIDRIVAFYCDLVGLEFRGDRSQPITYYSVPEINTFVAAPEGAEFRAAFMPIPGASPGRAESDRIYLEAFEYRHIDRRLQIPALTDISVTSLRFVVDDVDATLAALKAADIAVVTPGGEPIEVPAPLGFAGPARAVLVRDPDGYPVELLEAGASDGASSQVLGAQMTVVVADLPASLAFFERLVGGPLAMLEEAGWSDDGAFGALRAMAPIEHRRAAFVLPGSAVALELVELRGIEQERYAPVFQDIGFGHVAFETDDIDRATAMLGELGSHPIAASGTWTQIREGLRAVYTRDANGFFVELIEREAGP